MIGFVLRGMGFGGHGIIGTVIGATVACCALFGLYKMSQCRLRHCRCCRWLLRASGADSFDAFELMVFVHEVSFTSAGQLTTFVRVTAGEQQVATDQSKNKKFHQPLMIEIEQGADDLLVELVNAKRSRPLAKLELDVAQDILKAKTGNIRERTFVMRELSKEVVSVRISLSVKKKRISGEDDPDEEKGLLNDILPEHDEETRVMLEAHLGRINDDMCALASKNPNAGLPEEVQRMNIVAQGCSGPVEAVGGWGGKTNMWLKVLTPPENKKFALGMWDGDREPAPSAAPDKEIVLTRVRGVVGHPQKDNAFVVSHCPAPGKTEDLMCFSKDRNRNVWVETLSMLVKMVHEQRKTGDKGKRRKPDGTESSAF